MKKLLKQVGLVLILTAVYLVVAVPFKVMSVIPGFADIRPVLMLNPVYGIFFGIPGCIAFAIGNLIGDLLSDSLRWSDLQNAVFTAHGKKPAQAIVRDRRDRSRGDYHHHAHGGIVIP